MKKSKHYRKDVIMARIIFAIFCVAIVVLLVVGAMELVKKINPQKEPNTQENTQNENTQNVFPNTSEPDTEETEIGSEIFGTEDESESQPEDEEIYGKTIVDLNLRTEPNTSCEVITTIPEGGEVLLLEDLNDGWYRVFYDGNEGYVSAKYIRITE